ncbi:uncharacterized protein LOC141528417 [Cotesia typhae]|uniref:uncharacterized protein LOC141528417 n=1 Tax=Cotesia typhae TaxID=2053667 RepID=UPI003D69D0ED
MGNPHRKYGLLLKVTSVASHHMRGPPSNTFIFKNYSIQNPQAFIFPNTYGIISYDNALVYLSDWLQNAQNAIPFNSYDVHMLMTPHNDVNPNVGGSTHMGSACSGLRYGKPLGGLIRDNNDSELSKIINGAHELGHALGLPHDNQIGEEAIPSYLMMSSFNPSQKWSYDSKKKMQQSMQSQDFSCLDNYPQVASSPPKILSPDNNNNGVYNHQPPITNRTPRPHNNNKPNAENDRLLISSKMKITWILLSLISLAASIPLKEREAIYREHGCKETECEIAQLKLSHRQKRSGDSSISLPFNVFGRIRILHLRRSRGILVGPNTPVYMARSTPSGIDIRKKYGMIRPYVPYEYYEDIENSAAFILDTNSDKSRINYGYLASDNLEINPVNSFTSQIGDYYLVKRATDIPKFRLPNNIDRSKSIPKVIYPEILVMVIVDFTFYAKYGFSGIIKRALNIWNRAALFYNMLQNTQYKLTIAGIVIPEDPYVFNFMNPRLISGVPVLDYDQVLEDISDWLVGANASIPYISYDVHMIISPYKHGNDNITNVTGKATMNSVCRNVLAGKPGGGIIYESTVNDKETSATASHELGHALGVHHDGWNKSQGPYTTLMATVTNEKSYKWAPESLEEFHQSLEKRDFSCLYNEPDLGYDFEILRININPPRF